MAHEGGGKVAESSLQAGGVKLFTITLPFPFL